ncbi:hypothetical protein M569_11183 [Genlisea aurea]|uniref:Uncharacterized protein n=1 Tax=Genlisea aurea TaxID=192259 RepID=S8DUL7_9LAMI|nr:hypothetical protein M569_11183 [Genlisea aurea]
MHDRMGGKLCGSYLRSTRHERKQLQSRTILLRRSIETYLLSSLYIDMLHLCSFPSPDIVPHNLQYFELCAHCIRSRFLCDYALVDGGRKKMVQRSCKKRRLLK